MFETPIVFIIFRRPDTTQRVFDEIAKVKPKQLYVIADGPRTPEDIPRVEATRSIIDQVDWECRVHKKIADENLGLRHGISSGLNWVFEQVEEAIIVEDDCLPHPTFFQYCEDLLNYYRDDERVMHISGDNFGYKRARGVNDSYFFSRYAYIWGWATWRRAWEKYDVNMLDWEINSKDILGKLERPMDRVFWEKHWQNTYEAKNRTWSYQWLYTCIKHDGLCVTPYENLVANIGMGNASTNTNDPNSLLAELSTKAIEFPLIHPMSMTFNTKGEQKFARIYWMPEVSFIHRMWAKILKIRKIRGVIKTKIERYRSKYHSN